jgi:hypothetical protein
MGETPSGPSEWAIALWNHVEGQVEFGESKAGQLLAANSILLAAVVLVASEFRQDITGAAFVLAFVAVLLLSGSLLLVLMAIAPAQRLLESGSVWSNRAWTRLLGQSALTYQEPAGEPDLTHFADIAKLPWSDFVKSASDADGATVELYLLQSIHGKAAWARHKFRWLDKAVKLSMAAITVIVVATLVEAVVLTTD